MTLGEFFNQYEILPEDKGNVGVMIKKSSQLQDVCEMVSKYYPSWGFIRDMYAHYTRQDIESLAWSFDQLKQVLTLLNIWDAEIEQISSFLTALPQLNMQSIFQLSKIEIPLDTSFQLNIRNNATEVESNILSNYIRQDSGLVDSSTKIMFSDKTYLIPDEQSLKEIILHYDDNKLKYQHQSRDCDDFALMFKAHLSKIGIGNVSIGIAFAIMTDEDENYTANHAINLCVYKKDNGELNHIFYEPQSDFNFFIKSGSFIDNIFKDTTSTVYEDIRIYFLLI